MKPATPKTELPPSTQLRKVVFGGSLKNPLVRAGIVLGLGFGGFTDGIVLHQILGWHHLVCVTAHCQPTSIEQLQLQNTQDGFFIWLSGRCRWLERRCYFVPRATLARRGMAGFCLAQCWRGAACLISLKALLTIRFLGFITFFPVIRISYCLTCFFWRTGLFFL